VTTPNAGHGNAATGNWHMEIRDCFHGLPEVRRQFMASAVRRTPSKNEMVFYEEEHSQSCFYIERGIIKIFKISLSGKEPIFFMRHQGEMFGIAEVVNDKQRKCNAQAITDCVLHELPKKHFETLVAASPAFALMVISVLGTRIRYLGEQIESLMVCDVSARLARLLIYLAFNQLSDPASWQQPVELEKVITQEQMAAMTGSCQQTISATLKAFQAEGLIAVNRRRITVRDPTALLGRAEN
jgi:CRP/FNR family transcriptional regulator, cyclic AMP receptor protein